MLDGPIPVIPPLGCMHDVTFKRTLVLPKSEMEKQVNKCDHD
jgi:hypothetical protein